MKLLHTNEAALSRLSIAGLGAVSPASARATKRTVTALLSEGIMQVVTSK
jgi:hypothetical protein